MDRFKIRLGGRLFATGAMIGSLLLTCAHSGEHEFFPAADGDEAQCSLEGTIVPGDFEALALNVARGCLTLWVSSPGGSLDAALALGRIVRGAEMWVAVERGKRCASACVFLYAGGVLRAPYGKILIHRPYLENSSASFTETQQRFSTIAQRAKAFLREVNVNDGLFDRMMTIPPEKARALSHEEMEALGLGYNDQVYTEFVENRRAASAGITKKAFLLKKEQTAQRCGPIDGMIPSREIESRMRCWQQSFPEYFLPISEESRDPQGGN